MTYASFDRRQFLLGLSTGAGALWLGSDAGLVRRAAAEARRIAPTDPWRALTTDQAAALDALTARIFPTTDTPGAQEAGVVRFIDQALATFAAPDLPLIRQGLVDLDREAHRRDPAVGAFARLDPVRQADILRALDGAGSPFFETIRIATIQGLFANPEYGGNRDKIGWKLIGFEDRFAWQAPFGDYDR
jgi:gluconate 2-dehydrogenase gamma chain